MRNDGEARLAPGAGLADLPARGHRRSGRSALPAYRLRVAWRDKHGIVRRPARDETVSASTLREAVAAVLGDADGLLIEGTNFAWLSDEEENLLWTLHMDDFNAEST